MKNFDIEKLERKNIYKTPENFFQSIQEKVLYETVEKEKSQSVSAKIIPLKWIYSAAASVVILISATLMFDWDQNTGQSKLTQTKEMIEEIKTPSPNIEEENPAPVLEQTTYSLASNTDVQQITETPQDKASPSPQKQLTTPQLKNSGEMKTEEKMDLILESLSEEDLSALAANTEDDIYLDLYY